MSAASVQHCPACETEFVAGVRECSDCGGPLTAGELPPREDRRKPVAAEAGVGAAEALDTLLVELPGMEAELVASALAMEGISSLLQCEGMHSLRGPEAPPAPPLAVTLATSIHVAAAHLEEARQIMESVRHEDVVGDQWFESEEPPDDGGGAAEAGDETRWVPADEVGADPHGEAGLRAGDTRDTDGPQSEDSTTRFVLVALLAGVVILALMLL